MRQIKRALLLAAYVGIIGCLSGCAADGAEATPQPAVSAQATASATADETQRAVVLSPSAEATPAATQAPRANLNITVDGKTLKNKAMTEDDETFLPLTETAEALGYKAAVSELEEDTQRRRVHTFSIGADKSREVAVSYLLKDNTATDISFARDKMIVPVDRVLQFEGDVVYAPEDFFEEAMEADIETDEEGKKVTVRSPQAKNATPAPEGTAQATAEP